jgi:uncharacterized protein
VLIDVHTHLNNYDEKRSVPLEERIKALLSTMESNGVTAACVLTSYKVSEHRPSVGEVLAALEEVPALSVVAGVSCLEGAKVELGEIGEYLQEGRIKGIKIYPGYEPFYPWDERLHPVCELCVEHDVPLMVHTGDTYSPRGRLKYAHPLQVDELAVDHPNLKIVICHLGNPWFRDCMEVIYKNRNVYADFSGLVLGNFDDRFEKWLQEQLEEILLYAGEPRYLLFGSDWPISSLESYVDFVKELDMSQKNKDLILYQNAARLFRIPLPDGVEAGPSSPRA